MGNYPERDTVNQIIFLALIFCFYNARMYICCGRKMNFNSSDFKSWSLAFNLFLTTKFLFPVIDNQTIKFNS